MESGIEQRAFPILVYLLLSGFITAVEMAEPWRRTNKPTNSITIRQSDICLNHAKGEFVKNPNDCKLFYLCMDNGEAVLASCPPTMLFNSQTQLCDVATNVQCNIAKEMGESATGTAAGTDAGSGTGTGIGGDNFSTEILDAPSYCATLTQQLNQIVFIGSSTDCRQYYICYYGQALLQECSADLHWNANIGKCDLPSKASCTLGINGNQQNGGMPQNGVSSQISGPQQNSGNLNTGASDLMNCPTYGEHIFPHMERCEFFIFCVKGNAILQRCPFYYHFDIIAKTCKWRTTALCVQDINI